MKKINVLQFHLTENFGGTEKYILNNWKFIDREKFEFHFISYGKNLGLFSEQVGSNERFKIISCNAATDKDKFIKDVRNILEQTSYDVIHLHTQWWRGLILEELAVEYKIPKIIVHSHSTGISISDEKGRNKRIQKHNKIKKQFNISLATNFCACSKAASDWLFGEQIPRDKIEILKNSIDVEQYLFNKEIREKYRKQFNLNHCFVLGHVGRMVYPKNYEFLLRVFSQISQKKSNARLLLVGTGPLEEEIKALARELNVDNKVIYTGLRSDVNHLLQAMDVFCLPSRFEGLGIVLVEALSAGLKCLASDAVPDEINICDNIRFLPLDIEQWVQSLDEISQGYRRQNMYEIITESGYNIKYQIKDVEKIYMR